MDLRQVLVDSIDRVIAGEDFRKRIDDSVTKCVHQIVIDTLSRYSDFGKSVEAAVKKTLALNEDLQLPGYNHAILKIVERQVEAATHGSIQREVASRMKELLTEPPAEITLSALVEEYKKQLNDKSDSGCVCYGDQKIYLDITHQDYGFTRITISDQKPEKYSGPDISLGITKTGEVYHLAFARTDVETQMFVGNFYGFERMLFQMRAAKSRVVIDCDPSDLDLNYGHQYD